MALSLVAAMQLPHHGKVCAAVLDGQTERWAARLPPKRRTCH